MAAVNLHDLCNNLTSGQVRPRQTALNDLQRILNNEDASSRFKDEVAYSGLLETLTRNFSIELAGFRKSNSAQATSLLQLSADCFRVTVEKARLVITKSTVKLLLNHIHESLPNSGQPGYNEIAARFFAALKAITSHPPHVEQMTKDMWQKTEDLCRSHVDVISVYNLNAANDATAPEQEELPVEIRSYLPMRRELGDLLFSLQSLYTFPGAPFYGVEEAVLTFLLNFLASYDTVSESRMSAIIALNRLLEHITVNKIELTTRACSNIVHLSSKIWEVRISGFKERILIALAFIFPHLHESAAKDGINSGLRTRIENLLETMRGDFRIQEQKVGLLLDDLVLATLPPQSEAWKSRPFQFVVGPFFSLNPYSKTAELPWLSFQIQSGFIYLLDLVPKQSSYSNGDPHPKRRRLSPNLNLQKLLDDILRFKGQHVTSLVLLQRLAFYLNSFRLSTDLIDISEIVNYLENISDENNTELVGWSFVCMLAILGRTSPSGVTSSKSEQWTRIWVSCLKQAALPATCRSACAVMEAIVCKDILNVRSLLPHLKPIMDYVEQRGPGLLADNSCAFWNALLYKLEDLGISTESLRHDTLMRWMRFRWDAHGIGEVASRSKRLSNIALPCLRLFSSQRWKSGCQIDFNHIQSTPLSVVGQALQCISSNLRLLNFLLQSEVEWETLSFFANKSRTDSNITPKGHLEDVLRESFNNTSAEISRLTNSRQVADALAVSQDDIFWFVSVAMLSRLILRNPPSLSELT
jgi:serine-protein kinase ATM